MKTKIIPTEKPKTFEPVTIQVTIESEEELLNLYHRLNISTMAVRKVANKGAKLTDDHRLFHIINNIVDNKEINPYKSILKVNSPHR